MLVHMLCSLCFPNQYIHVLSLPIVAMRMLFGVRLKCIFEFVLRIVTHDDFSCACKIAHSCENAHSCDQHFMGKMA